MARLGIDRWACDRLAPLVSILLIAVATLGIAPAQPEEPLRLRQYTYAPADPAGGQGHLLDLYLPKTADKPIPIVIWTGGSAWKRDNGKAKAGRIAAHLNPAGLAVAGVSIRSSAQTTFPGQLYDIKAAIRWLRANAASYNLDPNHIGIMGGSSGGWAAVMAAVTGDKPKLEGDIGTPGVSSAVQAAVAFYPPTDFLSMGGTTTAPRRLDLYFSAAPSKPAPKRRRKPILCGTSRARTRQS